MAQRHEISQQWRELRCADKLARFFKSTVRLNEQNSVCLKETVKSAIWKLEITVNRRPTPIILKIFKPPVIDQNLIELNMYRKAGSLLAEVMPTIFVVADSLYDGQSWVFMEYVPPFKGQVAFTPYHYERIIPSLAKLHARTINDRFYKNWALFSGWLPHYEVKEAFRERQQVKESLLVSLDEAMTHPELKQKLRPSYKLLTRIVQKGPTYFPEVIKAGKSILHNDLQTPNMGCHSISGKDWRIQFIDWEGAHFAPCWFDLYHLLGVFFAYRKDWRNKEESISRHCAKLYAAEMQKYGISFHEKPMKLYKMAYLQRILERSLYIQLQNGLSGHKPAYLLDGYLEKIKVWGKELGLHDGP